MKECELSSELEAKVNTADEKEDEENVIEEDRSFQMNNNDGEMIMNIVTASFIPVCSIIIILSYQQIIHSSIHSFIQYNIINNILYSFDI